ncbi:MAG: sterol desaturase family protein [SAR324 cluster bacterium]|nr:sterol desaturase family protein [SAR324 cluster bacterium]
MALWEAVAPRRRRIAPTALRWLSNLTLVAVNTAVLRLAFPLLAVGLAALSAERGWGLLNQFTVPSWIAVAGSVVILDMAIYLQHVMVHAVPVFWRLHRMHHSDVDLDVTSGARFHPLEIVLSMGIKLILVAALGPPAVAVVIFEVLLNGTSMFNHSNVRIPEALDRWLRLVVVTPDMHRVHHSIIPRETNSNFGFNLPWWDRLFGTYRAQPEAGHGAMTLGISQFRQHRDMWLDRLLIQPLLGKKGDYTISGVERNESSGEGP